MLKRKLIYAVTSVATLEGAQKWLDFMTSTHIPHVLGKGFFNNGVRILELANDPKVTEPHKRFKVIYVVDTKQILEEHRAKFGQELKTEYEENVGDITLLTERVEEEFTEVTIQ